MSWFRNWLRRGQVVIDRGSPEYPDLSDIPDQGARVLADTTQRSLDSAFDDNSPELQDIGEIADGVDAININYSPDILLDYGAASSGSTIPDISGNNRDFTADGTEGVDFTWDPGGSHLVNAAGRLTLNSGAGWTPNTTFTGDHTFIAPIKANPGVFVAPDSNLNLYETAGSIAIFDGTVRAIGYNVAEDNEFTYSVVHNGANSIKLYINGLLLLEESTGSSITIDSSYIFSLGQSASGANTAPGDYDGFFMYKNAALTDDDIYQIYQYASGQKHYYKEIVVDELGIDGVCDFFYPTWETDGVDVMDVTGNNRHGVYVSTVSLGQPTLDDYTLSSVVFPVSASYIDVTENTIDLATDDFTIAGAADPSTASSTSGLFVLGTNNNYIGLFENFSNTSLNLRAADGTSNASSVIDTPSSEYGWCIRRKGDVVSWWVNGVRQSDMDISSMSFASDFRLYLGNWRFAAINNYDGKFQHRGTYSVALDESQCQRLSELDPTPKTTLETINTIHSPEILLDFNSQTNGSAVIKDVSGNNRDFTADGTEGVDFTWKYNQGHLANIPGRIELRSGAAWTSNATFSGAHSFVLGTKTDMQSAAAGIIGVNSGSFSYEAGGAGIGGLIVRDGPTRFSPYDGGDDNEFLVAIVHDQPGSGTLKWYCNGLFVWSDPASARTFNSGTSWTIGQRADGTLPSIGDYDGLFMYKNAALTDDDIYSIYTKSTGQFHYWREEIVARGLDASAVAACPLWEIDGADVMDVSGNENYGQYISGPQLGLEPIDVTRSLYSAGCTSSAYAEIPNPIGADLLANDWTVRLSLRPPGESATGCRFFIDSSNQIIFSFVTRGRAKVETFIGGVEVQATLGNDSYFFPNDCGLCIRHDSATNELTFWLNENQSPTVDLSSLVGTLDAPFQIFSHAENFVMFDAALSDEECSRLSRAHANDYYSDIVKPLLGDGCFAHYRLGENPTFNVHDTAVDFEGRYLDNATDGTYINSPTLYQLPLVPGDSGRSALFSKASSEYVNLSNSSEWAYINQTGIFGISAWFESPADNDAINAICGNSFSASNEGYVLVADWRSAGGEQIRAIFFASGSAHEINAPIPDAGTINHIVFTGDGSNVYLYINGELMGSTAIVTDSGTPTAVNSIANYAQSSNGHFDGRIDEVTYSDRFLDVKMVEALYKVRAVRSYYSVVKKVLGGTNIVGHWSLDEESGTIANDETGANSGTYTGTVNLKQMQLNPGGGYSAEFNGSSGYVDFGVVSDLDFIQNSGVFTISLWCDYTATGVIQNVTATSITNLSDGWYIRIRNTNTVDFGINAATTFEAGQTPAISDGVHHIVCTGDGSTARIYVDGVEEASFAFTAGGGANARGFAIGAALDGAATGFFGGRIDNVTIANTTASSADVQKLYEEGLL